VSEPDWEPDDNAAFDEDDDEDDDEDLELDEESIEQLTSPEAIGDDED
jgi:hypothetical protein